MNENTTMQPGQVRRLLRGGRQCVVYDRAPRAVSDYQDKLLSAMRFGFGGHLEKSGK